MCHFYGFKPQETLSLDFDIFQSLWAAITVIEAQKFLSDAQIASWTQLKKADRDNIRREMHKKAFPQGFSPEKASLTAKDLAAKMAMRASHGRRK